MRTATGLSLEQLRRLTWAIEEARDFTSEQRRKAAKEGAALGDGSFPIYNQGDLDNAVRAIGRGGAATSTIVAHIRKRAKALGLRLPDSMNGSGSSSSD